jgi:hypothetical protein
MAGTIIPLAAALVGAAAALTTASVSGLLNWRSNRHDHWWARAQWAMERALSDDVQTRSVGLTVLDALLAGTLATAEEDEMLLSVGATLRLPEGDSS